MENLCKQRVEPSLFELTEVLPSFAKENERNISFLSYRRGQSFYKRCRVVVANFDLNLQNIPIIWEIFQRKRQ